VGSHRGLLRLSAERYEQALSDFPSEPLKQTLLLIVARGNRDPEAVAEMHRFVRRRGEFAPVRHVRACFLARAEPALDRVLADIDHTTFGRVVIQPHLLYVGKVLASLRERVERMRKSFPETEWVLADHLGSSDLLTGTIVDLIDRAEFSEPPESGHVDA
jgi:sirohydrochlorin cobaltochelatase